MNFFTKKPVVGEIWMIKADKEDPFPPKANRWEAKILGVQNGWVRYQIDIHRPDERIKIQTFISVYAKKEIGS